MRRRRHVVVSAWVVAQRPHSIKPACRQPSYPPPSLPIPPLFMHPSESRSPKPWGGPYKNAITTELFISASASLSGYEAFLGKPEGYYGGWAAKATGWFNASGMVNSQWLVNDGLQVASNGECSNNKGTPWSYNQGCMLDGFALQGGYYLAAAQNIATAAVAALTGSDGSFSEPCGDGCDNDAKIFRGVFVRHLAYMLALPGVNVDPSFRSAMGTFLQKNVELLVGSASCPGNVTSGFGPYGLEWAGPCKVAGVATTSAALDLLVAAISAGVQSAIPVAKQARGTVAGAWPAVGAGACVDATGQQMPSCSAPNISESACYAAADSDHNAVAYDFTTNCDGSTLCRVRTSGGPGACQPGFTFTDGPAKSVTGGDGSALALCAALS